MELLLTRRQTEIVALIAEGLTNHQIADRLHIGPGTVRTHLRLVFATLGVQTRHQAVMAAHRAGVIA